MRPTPATTLTPSTPSSSSSSSPQFWRLNSPLPYLFGGLAIMLILIAAALILLACSYRRRQVPDEEEEKPKQMYAVSAAVDCSPKIVVIMAGADNPTHLAVPVPSSKPAGPSECVCSKV